MVGEEFDRAAQDSKALGDNTVALAKMLGQTPSGIDTAKAIALINAGIEPDMRFKDENTLLILAAFAMKTEVVTALLEHGANPNLANIRQEVPLHYAAKALMVDALKSLLNHGADIYARDEFGDNAEDMAARGNHPGLSAEETRKTAETARSILYDAARARIKRDMDAAHLREEVKAFTAEGCATRESVKPMKRLQIKTPGGE